MAQVELTIGGKKQLYNHIKMTNYTQLIQLYIILVFIEHIVSIVGGENYISRASNNNDNLLLAQYKFTNE